MNHPTGHLWAVRYRIVPDIDVNVACFCACPEVAVGYVNADSRDEAIAVAAEAWPTAALEPSFAVAYVGPVGR